MENSKSVLALDIGERRIGVAVASLAARLPRPLTVLDRSSGDEAVIDHLRTVAAEHGVTRLVIGLPRGLDGQETQQTASTRTYGESLAVSVGLPYDFQDEAGTSLQAEAELSARGRPYAKGDVDSLAATYILQDWLQAHPSGDAT